MPEKNNTDESIAAYVERQKGDCRRHLKLTEFDSDPDYASHGARVPRECMGCFHCSLDLVPFCRVTRVEGRIAPRRRMVPVEGAD